MSAPDAPTQWHAISYQVRSVAVTQGVQARSLGKTEPAEQQRNRRRDRIRPERCSVRVGEDQVQVRPVFRPELRAEFILALPMRVESSKRGRRHFQVPRPLRFRTLELQRLPRLPERSRYDG